MFELQRYSQSCHMACRHTERHQEVVPASGSHWQPMDTFLFHRNYTRQTSGTAMNREAAGFVNSAVKRANFQIGLEWSLPVSRRLITTSSSSIQNSYVNKNRMQGVLNEIMESSMFKSNSPSFPAPCATGYTQRAKRKAARSQHFAVWVCYFKYYSWKEG